MDQGGYYGSFQPSAQAYCGGPSGRGVLPDLPAFPGPQSRSDTSKLDEILGMLKSQQQEISSLKSEVIATSNVLGTGI